MSKFEPNFVNVSELASRLGFSRQTVAKYIKLGKIKAIKTGNVYKISIDEAKRIERGGIL